MIPSASPPARPECSYTVRVDADEVRVSVTERGDGSAAGEHQFAAPVALDTAGPETTAVVDGPRLRLTGEEGADHRATVTHAPVRMETPVDELTAHVLRFESPTATTHIDLRTADPLVAAECHSRVPYRLDRAEQRLTCVGAGTASVVVTVGPAAAVEGTLRADGSELLFDADAAASQVDTVPYVSVPPDTYAEWFDRATPVARYGGIAYVDAGTVDAGTGRHRHGEWCTVRPPERETALETVSDSGRYVVLDCDLAAVLARPVGTQVKLVPEDGHAALFTVAEVTEQPGVTVRLTAAGRDRLGVDRSPFGAWVSPLVADPELSPVAARRCGGYTERLVGDGETLVACAPHGGDIEINTDLQAARVAARLGDVETTTWTCSGWDSSGEAFDRYHVSSTDLSPASYPLLAHIATREFDHAVSFHCHDNDDILVGGRAPESLRRAVGRAVEAAVGDEVAVRYTGEYMGRHGDNFVNWLTADGDSSVQLEQSPHVVKYRWRDVADAVAEAFRSRL